jgi:transposase
VTTPPAEADLEILDSKKQGRTTFFLVKRRTNPGGEPTWITQAKLKNADLALKTFWDNCDAEKKAKHAREIDEHRQAEIERWRQYEDQRANPEPKPADMPKRRTKKTGPEQRQEQQKSTRSRLTEYEKIQILLLDARGRTSLAIADVIHRPSSTIRTFLAKYERKHQLTDTLGRPRKPTSAELLAEVGRRARKNPLESLRFSAAAVGISPTAVRTLRHDQNIRFYHRIPIPEFKPGHAVARLAFADKLLKNGDAHKIIVFSDESTVQQGVRTKGIWRERGVPVPATFACYAKTAHPLSVMVWGAITKTGYRTRLLRCPASVTGDAYIELLKDNQIFEELDAVFGRGNYVWQQDGAPAHSPAKRDILVGIPMLNWPAKSPDLSPIEQLWSYLKQRLEDAVFSNADDLFKRLSEEWDRIPSALIQNLCSSFPARLVVCRELNGECLNGHWSRVHDIHHPNIE